MAALGLAVLAALLLAGPAWAQSQADMNREASDAHRAADADLNRAYVAIMAQASPDGRERLRAAQRDWIKFRDSDCAARAGSRGGSFYPTSLSTCLADVTRERTATLRADLACAEGEMNCGGHRED